MSTRAVVELFSQLLADDSPLAGEVVQVIPVVDDDLRADVQLFGDLLHSLGGVHLDLQQLGTEGVIGHPGDPALVTQVEHHLAAAAPPNTTLRLHIEGGVVRAALHGATSASNDSQRILLGAAVALFSLQLRGVPQAVVTYDETLLDEVSANAVWDLFACIAAGLRLGELRRLLVVAGGPRHIARHVDGRASARYTLVRGNLQTLKGPADLDARMSTLVSRDTRPLVLFLGAGFSASSGDLPLGDALRDQALMTMFGAARPGTTLSDMFYELVADNDLWTQAERHAGLPARDEFCRMLTLERVLLVEFDNYSGRQHSPTLQRFGELNRAACQQPGSAVRRLHQLLRRRHRIVLVTVNLDTLIESDSELPIEVLASPQELANAPGLIDRYLRTEPRPNDMRCKIPLLKLHGSIHELDTVIADVKHVALGLPAGVSNALARLADEADPVPWIYIGHSMRDRDVIEITRDRCFAVGTTETWVSPSLPEPVRQFAGMYRTQWWEQADRPQLLQQRHATVSADRFLASLNDRWDSRT